MDAVWQPTDISRHLTACDNAQKSLVILDASSHMASSGLDADKLFASDALQGAQRFHIDKVADQTASLPHMLPTPDDFLVALHHLGINAASHVLCYQQQSVMAAARAWWSFRVFGIDAVSILNGNLEHLTEISRAQIKAAPTSETFSADFTVAYRDELVANQEMVLSATSDHAVQILDARSAERFDGKIAEPRAGLRSGHIPSSLNMPFLELLDERSALRSPSELQEIFASRGIDTQKPTIASCGSGVTACTIALALYTLGNHSVRVYDGSWTEWGADVSLPIETSESR